MLILSRKKGQSIVINGDIEVFITGFDGDQVKLGIEAPDNVKIYRKEVLESIRESNKAAIANPSQLEAIKGMAAEVAKKRGPAE